MADAENRLGRLKNASELGQIQKDTVDSDYTDLTTGDLKGLYDKADPPLRAKLDSLKSALKANRRKSLSRRFLIPSPRLYV